MLLFPDHCPFCYSNLTEWEAPKIQKFTSFMCLSKSCMCGGDITRFFITFENKEFHSYEFLISDHYVQVEDGKTCIWYFDSGILENPVIINKAYLFDFSDIKNLENKINTILLFS